MDALFWADKWDEAASASPLRKHEISESAWKDFWNFFAENYAGRNKSNQKLIQRIISDLFDEGVINSESDVLDIGCGPGTYTLALAAKCKSATGLDSAGQMLDVLRREAIKAGQTRNLKTLPADWKTYAGDEKYDLVFGANTPAVNNYENLVKMNRYSRRFCCLIGFAGRFRSSLRDALWRSVMGCPVDNIAYDTQFPFNILYQEGFFPNVRFYEMNIRHIETIDYTIQHYTHYFRIFGKNGRDVKSRIEKIIEQQAEDRNVIDIHQSNLSVMWWSI